MAVVDRQLPHPDSVTGIVLAGGRGRRVGGADKGLLVVEDRPLATQVAANLRDHCSRVVVSANRNTARYARFADVVVPDRREGFQGPLAGLEAAMMAATTPWLLVTPCDMPEVPAALYRDLLVALAGDSGMQLVVADDGERVQPLVCALRRTALPALSRHLDEGGRAVHGWLDVTPHIRVAQVVPGGLGNLNRF